MARARSAPTRDTTPTDEEEEKAAEPIVLSPVDESVELGPTTEPRLVGEPNEAGEPEPAPAAAAELEAIFTELKSAPADEPPPFVMTEAAKAWVRREMTLAACGVDEAERKKLNP